MMKAPLGIFLGTITALSCSSFIGKTGAATTKLEPQKNQPKVNIQNLYNEACAKCHGAGGEGGGGGTKSLNTLDKYDQKWDRPFFDAIKVGVPDMGMSGYGETNSDEVIWGLVNYIRELQSRALSGAFWPKQNNGVYKSKYTNYRITEIANFGQGFRTPWSIDWLKDGTLLVTNRSGDLFATVPGQEAVKVQGTPRSVERGQGGMMDVRVHPTNGWVYLSYAEPSSSGDDKVQTKIVRGKIRVSNGTATWSDTQVIYQADQKYYTGAGVHFGSKIAFDGRGKLYFSIGERGENERSQQMDRPTGKIYRVNEDGSIPKDNPFYGQAENQQAAWTSGHRNPQGLVVLPNGEVWSTEHAPRGGDELNQINKGKNYGWPIISFGINYDGSQFRLPWDPQNRFAMPAFRWMPSIGASGLDYGRGNLFKAWNGDLFAGGLSGQSVDRIRVKDGKMVEFEPIVRGRGRVRDVRFGPDGALYVLLNDPGRILRVTP